MIQIPPEGICIFDEIGRAGVAAICSEGNHCKVTGTISDCEDSECTKITHITSVTAK